MRSKFILMSNSPGAAPPEPPSLQKRLPLALALMMLVLLVSQYIFKPAPGPKPVDARRTTNTRRSLPRSRPRTSA